MTLTRDALPSAAASLETSIGGNSQLIQCVTMCIMCIMCTMCIIQWTLLILDAGCEDTFLDEVQTPM